MGKFRVFIYCRVSDKQMKELLNFQEKELTNLLGSLDAQVVGIAKEISNGKGFGSYGMQKLIHYIINEKIDAVVVYDDTRLAIYDDLKDEFQMICYKHHVEIIDMSNLVSDVHIISQNLASLKNLYLEEDEHEQSLD